MRRVYHITHIDNLPAIVSANELLPMQLGSAAISAAPMLGWRGSKTGATPCLSLPIQGPTSAIMCRSTSVRAL